MLLWWLKSVQIKLRDDFRCQRCGSGLELNVHHHIYESHRRYDDYPGNYLITLCQNCHLAEHTAIEFFEFMEYDIREMQLNGMLAMDIYKKYKNKEIFNNE